MLQGILSKQTGQWWHTRWCFLVRVLQALGQALKKDSKGKNMGPPVRFPKSEQAWDTKACKVQAPKFHVASYRWTRAYVG